MLFAFGYTVLFKTPNNVFFRRFRRVEKVSAAQRENGQHVYVLHFLNGRGTAEIPQRGLIVRWGPKVNRKG